MAHSLEKDGCEMMVSAMLEVLLCSSKIATQAWKGLVSFGGVKGFPSVLHVFGFFQHLAALCSLSQQWKH